MSENFSFRWGIELFDNAHTQIPNWILKYYSELNITNIEMMFIIQLASFKFESEKGQASPSLTTIKDRMGYKSINGVRKIKQSLEDKKLLTVQERPGTTSIYDFSALSNAVMQIAMVETPTEQDPLTKVTPSTKVRGYPSTKVRDTPSQKWGGRRKEEEENNKKFSAEQKKSYSDVKNNQDVLSMMLGNMSNGVSESTASNPDDQWFEYRDKLVKSYHTVNKYMTNIEKEEVLILAQEAEASPDLFDRACRETALNYTGNKVTVGRVIEVYRFMQKNNGGTYRDWEQHKYGNGKPQQQNKIETFNGIPVFK